MAKQNNVAKTTFACLRYAMLTDFTSAKIRNAFCTQSVISYDYYLVAAWNGLDDYYGHVLFVYLLLQQRERLGLRIV
jgi:hypothetical protein